MDDPPPVRFRVVIELIFPDADPSDPSDYDKFLASMKETLENAQNVKCEDVLIREAMTIGPESDYEDWRGGPKYDLSSFGPNHGILLIGGADYPLPAVDPLELAKVWELIERADARELQHLHLLIAIGQALRPESNALATIARVLILRALQKRNAVPAGASTATFQNAANFPLEKRLESATELLSLARFF